MASGHLVILTDAETCHGIRGQAALYASTD